jgi:hypothetical protein
MSWGMALCISGRCIIVVIIVNKLVCTFTKDIVKVRGQVTVSGKYLVIF